MIRDGEGRHRTLAEGGRGGCIYRERRGDLTVQWVTERLAGGYSLSLKGVRGVDKEAAKQ